MENKPWENKPAVLDRLAGVETEYAIRLERKESYPNQWPSTEGILSSLFSAISSRVLTVPVRTGKEGVFLVNGGAVQREHLGIFQPRLIEGSTPECRSPSEVHLYQKAQDLLLAEAASKEKTAGNIQLIKNNRDSRGNLYGCHENYEATLASGLCLALWRAGMFILTPLVLLSWIGLLLLLLLVLLYPVLVGIAYLLLIRPFVRRRRKKVARFLFNLENGGEEMTWKARALYVLLRLVFIPLGTGFYVLGRALAFRRVRRQLLPFLVSRPVICGTGMLDRRGRFLLSEKSPGINCITGFNGLWNDRPIFSFGHFLKTAAFSTLYYPRSYLSLFRRRQRFQICLADSNMAPAAEYLKVATTMLVLDAVEAGALKGVPRLLFPLRALRKICADSTLQAKVMAWSGRRWGAIELQRLYLEGCRCFVDGQKEGNEEAGKILQRWEKMLNTLEEAPELLFGSVDWLTKKALLADAGPDAPEEVRRKICLRYHELSEEGYFARLEQAGVVSPMFPAENVYTAIQAPPRKTPAEARSRLISQFARSTVHVSATWNYVRIGRGWKAKVYRLDR